MFIIGSLGGYSPRTPHGSCIEKMLGNVAAVCYFTTKGLLARTMCPPSLRTYSTYTRKSLYWEAAMGT